MSTDRRLWGALVALALPVLVLWWPGCRQYPAVTSEDSLRLMKLLYTATNTRDDRRLSQVERGVEEADRAGRLSRPEREAFAKIVGMARGGEWADAEDAAFRFARDQVGQGGPAAEPYERDAAKKLPARQKAARN